MLPHFSDRGLSATAYIEGTHMDRNGTWDSDVKILTLAQMLNTNYITTLRSILPILCVYLDFDFSSFLGKIPPLRFCRSTDEHTISSIKYMNKTV